MIVLTVEKEESIAKYELKATMLKIPIFKRSGTKENGNGTEYEDKSEDNSKKQTKESDQSEDKSLKEKYEEIKPMRNHLKKKKLQKGAEKIFERPFKDNRFKKA